MRQAENGYLVQLWEAVVFLLGFGAFGAIGKVAPVAGLVIGLGLMTAGSWLWGRGRKIRDPNRKAGKPRSFRLTR